MYVVEYIINDTPLQQLISGQTTDGDLSNDDNNEFFILIFQMGLSVTAVISRRSL